MPISRIAVAPTTTIEDDGVVQGEERVEDERPRARDPARACHVEVPRIADEEHVELRGTHPQQASLREREPRCGRDAEPELVLGVLPDRDVRLGHLDARAAQARDHLCIPRVVALVRPEVENAHAERRQTSSSSPSYASS